jgi:hypothetical protein
LPPPVRASNAMPTRAQRLIRLARTEIRLRVRRPSTNSTPGSCSNCTQKVTAASRPIVVLEAPSCRAKAVRMTPLVTAVTALE